MRNFNEFMRYMLFEYFEMEPLVQQAVKELAPMIASDDESEVKNYLTKTGEDSPIKDEKIRTRVIGAVLLQAIKGMARKIVEYLVNDQWEMLEKSGAIAPAKQSAEHKKKLAIVNKDKDAENFYGDVLDAFTDKPLQSYKPKSAMTTLRIRHGKVPASIQHMRAPL